MLRSPSAYATGHIDYQIGLKKEKGHGEEIILSKYAN